MIYQVSVNLFFVDKDDAEDFVNRGHDAMEKAVVVHPNEPNQQGCSVELIMCYHDETPVKPCESCGEIYCP